MYEVGGFNISQRYFEPGFKISRGSKYYIIPESIRNWYGLWCGSIRVETGRYLFNSVWTRFEIRLCVTAFPECRPHSKLFWPVSARVDLHLIPDSPVIHRPLSTRSSKDKRKACETGSSPCWPVSNLSDSYRPVLALFIFWWPTFKSVYKNRI
jgi:hypothetical protein